MGGRLVALFNSFDKALAIVKESKDSHAEMSVYAVDKRYYMSERKFADIYAYPPEQAPYVFVYERGSSDGNIFIFRLKETD